MRQLFQYAGCGGILISSWVIPTNPRWGWGISAIACSMVAIFFASGSPIEWGFFGLEVILAAIAYKNWRVS